MKTGAASLIRCGTLFLFHFIQSLKTQKLARHLSFFLFFISNFTRYIYSCHVQHMPRGNAGTGCNAAKTPQNPPRQQRNEREKQGFDTTKKENKKTV